MQLLVATDCTRSRCLGNLDYRLNLPFSMNRCAITVVEPSACCVDSSRTLAADWTTHQTPKWRWGRRQGMTGASQNQQTYLFCHRQGHHPLASQRQPDEQSAPGHYIWLVGCMLPSSSEFTANGQHRPAVTGAAQSKPTDRAGRWPPRTMGRKFAAYHADIQHTMTRRFGVSAYPRYKPPPDWRHSARGKGNVGKPSVHPIRRRSNQ